MSLHDKLRLYLDGKGASWSTWNGRDTAAWEDDAPCLLVAVAGPLTADALVDAHVRALASEARLVVVHEGAPTSVALRTAARFGITLLDAASLPEAAPAPHAAPEAPSLPSPVAIPALPAHEEPPALAAPILKPEAPILLPAQPDDAMPWDVTVTTPEPQPVHVDAHELIAFPWVAHPEEEHDDHLELLPAGRTTRRFAGERPTQTPGNWGLPWTRPGVTPEALALQDPRIWRSQERIQAVRSDLDKLGAPSFGAAKPVDGSAWLRKISEG